MKKVGQLYRECLVGTVKENIDLNKNIFLLSYSNVSGLDLSNLRKDLKKAGASVYVSKNSVAKIALRDLEQERLREKVNGQTAFIWGDTDSVEISKVLIDFTKKSENILINGGLLEGKIIAGDDVKKLSELPTREVLLSMLLSAIQSPLTRLATALNAKTRDLLSILKQLSEKKGGN